jgi:hypothetical protein
MTKHGCITAPDVESGEAPIQLLGLFEDALCGCLEVFTPS